MRRGFTLIEMLVATGVFLVGFSATYGLFLAGMKCRRLAEDQMRCSLAAASIIEEMRLDAGMEGNGARKPSDYVGDGFAANNAEPNGLFPYKGLPGVWYRVMECTDVAATDSTATSTLHIRLLVLNLATIDSDMTLADVNKRLRLLTGTPTDEEIVAELVQRGLGLDHRAVLLRRPSWEH